MKQKTKSYCLVACIFLFLLVVLGSGLRLSPTSALITGVAGTPLVVAAWNRRSAEAFQEIINAVHAAEADRELEAVLAREASLRVRLTELIERNHRRLGHQCDFQECKSPDCCAHDDLLQTKAKPTPQRCRSDSRMA
jgi:hypothetical protein